MEETKITLPPPKRRGEPRRGVSAVWGWIVAALLLGVLIGVLIGERRQTGGSPVAGGAGEEAPVGLQSDPGVAKGLAEARVAMAAGQWVEARKLYLGVLAVEPGQVEAGAALPLIDRHIDSAQGRVFVETKPAGASVKLGKLEAKKSPATFEGVPIGSYVLEVSKEGYGKIERELVVRENRTEDPGVIELAPQAGSLSVSSEPKGVPFEILTVDGEKSSSGKTPVTLEKLPPGDYSVTLKMEGWPSFSEKVRIAHNRKASVSHVFAQGGLQVTSDPSGAEVWLTEKGKTEGRLAGSTPLSVPGLAVGQHELVVRYQDWPEIRRVVEIEEGRERALEFAWQRGLVDFTSDPPGAEVFLNDKRIGRGGETTPLQWELPEGEYQFVARRNGLDEVAVAGEVRAEGGNEIAFGFQYGSVRIGSEPPGATVVLNGVPMGRTPFQQDVVRPGDYQYELRKAQHRSAVVSGEVKPGQSLDFNAALKYDPAPVLDHDFTNSYGQKMQWVAPLREWVAAHEVTQGVYEAVSGENPSAFKRAQHPVESVSWYDAKRFCEKLTINEQAKGTLPKGFVYDLPSDEEWSVFVGGARLEDAVTSRLGQLDGTAEVGTSQPNEYGLFDVRGNVWEWCDDWYSQKILNRTRQAKSPSNPSWVGTERKVLRGGSWSRSSGYDLANGYRLAVQPSKEDRYDCGFRVVLKRE